VQLHDYQVRAVDHLQDGDGGKGLFLDMGLGKTAAVLSALTGDHLPALVLAPKRVAEEVWHVEREIWRPDLSLAVAVGNPRQRAHALKVHADVTVMTRDTISDLGKRVHPYKTVVLDELSGYKTKSTNRWKDTRYVTTQAAHVWGLTGTPTPNGYHDLWGQIFLLDKGKRLGTTLTAFRDRYFNPGRRMPVTNVVIEWILKPGAEDAINALLADLCLSMKAEDYLELPDLTFNEITVPLPSKVKTIYHDLMDNLVADLTLIGGTVHTAANAATLSGKARQLSAGFLYTDGDTTTWDWLHDEKVKAVQEIVEGTGSPVLVFYAFGAEREALKKALPGVRTIDQPGVIADWNAGKVRVLLAHPQSAGHGLNLQAGGHTIVWSSLPWSLEEWQQSNKRLHRQGQRHPVVIHVLLSPGTLDRGVVYRSLKDKTSVQDALLAYLREDHLWL
jgi:SNF2 family DNA or RNA helicase